jgi:uncharacterized protein YqhQ
VQTGVERPPADVRTPTAPEPAPRSGGSREPARDALGDGVGTLTVPEPTPRSGGSREPACDARRGGVGTPAGSAGRGEGAKPPRRIDIGGQAVIEGVMMRSPSCFVVACRRADGSIVVREDRWRSVWEKVRFLRWPFLRGGVVLWETLHNGMSSLSFAASVQMEDEIEKAKAAGKPIPRKEEMGAGAITRMMGTALVLVLAFFVVLPHLLTWLLGFKPESVAFHLVDGLIKLCVLVAYVGGISLLPDIRRVYQYHGAEHKAIATHEADEPLTVASARTHSRFHPRCGTSFLLIVILASVVIFALALKTRIAQPAILDHLVKILIKLPLMLPIAGISYELIKLAGRWPRSPLVRTLVAPGLWLQRLTTREPDEQQLEIALTAVGRALARAVEPDASPTRALTTFRGYDEVLAAPATSGAEALHA